MTRCAATSTAYVRRCSVVLPLQMGRRSHDGEHLIVRLLYHREEYAALGIHPRQQEFRGSVAPTREPRAPVLSVAVAFPDSVYFIFIATSGF